MKAFPDAEVLLAALAEEGLSARHRAALAAAEAVVVSAAVLWQIEGWRAAGALEIRGDLADTLRRAGCLMLAVTAEHVAAAGALARGQGRAADESDRRASGKLGQGSGERDSGRSARRSFEREPELRWIPNAASLLPPLPPLLAVQARAEGLVILSSDRVYRLYDVEWL
ncbi:MULTISPECIES: PIN domain-containing protein [unclassified Haematobacter]|uniref:PIN domain-containing protein n=1 Tax=unclassified Haematobacter TaxID=2640585 RepID=UPI0025C4BB83|nr:MULTISPECIES: PIN domain-containing protein [unclassified Haematobacter]